MKYKKILIKFSGEAFGPKGKAVDIKMIEAIALEIKNLADSGIKVAVVTGGGNVARGREADKAHRLRAHLKGMSGTFQNVEPLYFALKKLKLKAQVYTSFSLNHHKYPRFDQNKAVKDWQAGKILLFAGGTGHPFFTTDSAAVLRALQLGAEIFIKATKVAGVYSCDPLAGKNCRFYKTVPYKKVVLSELNIIDKMAIALAWDNQLPIRVVKWQAGSILKIAAGQALGTLIG